MIWTLDSNDLTEIKNLKYGEIVLMEKGSKQSFHFLIWRQEQNMGTFVSQTWPSLC